MLFFLIPTLSGIPSAIAVIPFILIMVGIVSYLRELIEKINVEQGESSIVFFMLPVVLLITSIMILGILLGASSSPSRLPLIDWLFRLIVIEAVSLYIILLYDKVKYTSYLEVVSIILNEMILEEDRKLWLK